MVMAMVVVETHIYILEVEQEQEDGLMKVSLAMVAEQPIVVED